MIITTDISNVFNFFGDTGIGVGYHSNRDFISSVKLSGLFEIVNLIGYVSMYHRLSEDGHYSCFYGNLIVRRDGTDVGMFLDSSRSFYGIVLDPNVASPISYTDTYDATTRVFNIPIDPEGVYGNYFPYVRFGTLYQDSSLYKFVPVLQGVDFSQNTKVIKLALYNQFDGTMFSTTDYSSLGDSDLQISIFGIRPIPHTEL